MDTAASTHSRKPFPCWFWWIWAFGILVILLNVNLTWFDGDEARYVSLARALAEGQGWTDLTTPTPRPDVTSPPLFPLALATVSRLFGERIALFSLVSAGAYAVCWTVWVVLSVRLGRGRFLQGAALSIIGGLSVYVLGFVWRIFTEPLFMALVYLALWSSLKADERHPWRWALLAGIFATCAGLTRLPGLTLLPAIALPLVQRKPRLRVLVFAAAVALTLLPFVGLLADIITFYGQRDYTASPSSGGSLARTVGIVAECLPYYLFESLPTALFYRLLGPDGLLTRIGLGPLEGGVAFAIGLLTLIGWLSRLRRPTALEWFWLFYWPSVSSHYFWPQPRYYAPIIPLAGFYLVEGWQSVGALFRGRAKPWGRRVAVVGVALCALYSALAAWGASYVRTRNEWRAWGLHPWDPERHERLATEDHRAFARYIQAASWIGRNTSTGDWVASRKPKHTYLFSRRGGFRYDGVDAESSLTDPWAFMQAHARKEGSLLILEDAFPTTSSYGAGRVRLLEPLLEEHADQLELLYETADPTTRVWRVKPEAGR